MNSQVEIREMLATGHAVVVTTEDMARFTGEMTRRIKLEKELAESKLRETELQKRLDNAQRLQQLTLDNEIRWMKLHERAENERKGMENLLNESAARVKTLEDALKDASSVAEDFRRVIVQVYPDATRQDNPYYTIRNHMAAVLRVLDVQALAAKEPK